jgi:vacuolar iron transporter family protein
MGAGLDSGIIIILGFANLIADGFSMSVGNFFSVKALMDNYNEMPANERAGELLIQKSDSDIRQYFLERGLKSEAIPEVTGVINACKKISGELTDGNQRWLIKMPVMTALATFISFNIMGLIPLLFYLFDLIFQFNIENLFLFSCIATGLSLAIIGTLKSIVSRKSALRGVIETVGLGGLAAVLAYFAGSVIEGLLR